MIACKFEHRSQCGERRFPDKKKRKRAQRALDEIEHVLISDLRGGGKKKKKKKEDCIATTAGEKIRTAKITRWVIADIFNRD